MAEQKNWAGNYTYQADNWHYPKSVEEVQEIVENCQHVRVVGSRHSFNSIADSPENLISLQHMNRVLSLDVETQTVTVEGGIIYSDLCQFLGKTDYALQNMASLPHISVVGACATATHGSGDNNTGLAAAIRALEVVTADGKLVTFSREEDSDALKGVVVGLGALGVITKVTLALVPAYQIRQDVYENLPMEQLEEHFDEISASAYSVSLFTDWKNKRFTQVWLKSKVTEEERFPLGEDFFGATRATENLHPLGLGTENCNAQLGVAGPWLDRLSHFRMGFTPSSGEELQSEYLMPREHAYQAVQAISALGDQIAPLLHVSEVRTIAKDDLWMSMAYEQESVAIHFTWKDNWEAVKKVLPKIEEALAPFQPRPHWGKLFTMPAEQVQASYEKITDFRQLLSKYDPDGKFRNAFVNEFIFRME